MLFRIKQSLRKYFKESLLKAIIGVLLFTIVYMFSNTELIRKNFEDLAFDLTNQFFLSHKAKTTNSPKVHLFVVDEKYLKQNKLLSDNNETNYGYIFPRSHIANFIKNLDMHIKGKENIQPSILFIDYDLSYTSSLKNEGLSSEDLELLNILKQPRNYIIMLPKTNHFNFIEDSNDLEIIKLINERQIIFSSVGLRISSDYITRRYDSCKEYDKTLYYGAAINIFNISKNLHISMKDCDVNDVVEKRIIYKQYKEIGSTDEYNAKQSYWTNLFKYSANYPLDFIIDENLNNSIIMYGSSHKGNKDIFNSNSIFGTTSFFGVDIHANALMTLYDKNGNLKKTNFFFSIFIIFIIFIVANLITEVSFELFNLQKYRKIEFMTSLLITISFMIYLSLVLLENYSSWFNWIAPLILFEVFELLEALKVFNLWKWILKVNKGRT